MKRTGTATWDGRRWRISVQKDGIRKTFYSSKEGRNGQREANAKADRWLDMGLIESYKRVGECFEAFLKDAEERTSYSNWRLCSNIWKNHLQSLAHKKIEQLNENDLQMALNEMNAKGLSRKYISNARGVITSFMKFCRRNKWTDLRPEYLSVPTQAPVGEKRALTPHELIILFSSSSTLYHKKVIEDEYINMYRLQVLTGLRPGELLGIRTIDLNDGFLTVNQAINFYGETTHGKNANARRRFKLSAMAVNVVADQLQRNIRHGLGELLFGPIKEQTYYKAWKRYCEYNGIQPISVYELRHTFITYVGSLSEAEIKSMVGHSAKFDTFTVYGSHRNDCGSEATAQKVDEIFSSVVNK